MVFAGGSQVLARSWNGKEHWGGLAGTLATMRTEGNRVISAIDNKIRSIDNNWTGNMDQK
ncbi:MAG TPA: hypothetical protein VN227_04155 [Methanoregula sp.]|nr:hypothetical protein [Methanoregula sp.]